DPARWERTGGFGRSPPPPCRPRLTRASGPGGRPGSNGRANPARGRAGEPRRAGTRSAPPRRAGITGRAGGPTRRRPPAPTAASAGAAHPRLLEGGDPRTRAEILAVLDRLIANVVGLVPETEVATLRSIRDSAARALPATDAPLDLIDHDTWLLRQICIDYV